MNHSIRYLAMFCSILICKINLHAQTLTNVTKRSPYYLYMTCVKPFAHLTNRHKSYPGHIFLGYVVRNWQDQDSLIQYCGNQPASPLFKQLFKKRNGNNCLTIEGYMSMNEDVYAKYKKAYILQIPVSKEEYEYAMLIRDKWEARKLFKVNGMDCVSFVEEVAVNALHFKPLRRNYFQNLIPIRYWKHQIKQNKSRISCTSIYFCTMPKK